MIGVRNAAFLGRPFPPYDLTRLPGMFFLQQGGLSDSEGGLFLFRKGMHGYSLQFSISSLLILSK